MIDYCVASLVIVVSAVLILSIRADKHKDTQIDADERFTPATIFGVSNKIT